MHNRLVEIFLVCVYNLCLLAGACYLIQVYDWSAWILLLALMFGASWEDKKAVSLEIGK